MKREYTKPQVFAESFELMEHISGACGEITGHASYRDGVSCHYDVEEGLVYFVNDTHGCTEDPGDGEIPPEDFTGVTRNCKYAFGALVNKNWTRNNKKLDS